MLSSLEKWCALLALLGAAAAAAAAGQSNYKAYPRTVARIEGGHSSPDLLYEPTLEYVAKPAGYAFAYGVEDPYSGNAQSHQEERDGDVVRGEYKVMEPDGSVRTVTYTVDPKSGFQANVEHSDPDDVPFSAYSSRQQLQSRASSPASSSSEAGPGAASAEQQAPGGHTAHGSKPGGGEETSDFFFD